MNPCYKCENREIGCHGKCALYIEWKVNYENNKKEMYDILDKEKEYDNYKYDIIRKTKRRH